MQRPHALHILFLDTERSAGSTAKIWAKPKKRTTEAWITKDMWTTLCRNFNLSVSNIVAFEAEKQKTAVVEPAKNCFVNKPYPT